jgi:hypothetical protein
MKKLVMFVLIAFCATLTVDPAIAMGKKSMKGTWEYKVPSAPYEYSAGKIIIGETNGQSTVTVKFRYGSEVKAQNVKIEGDSLSFGVDVEYNYVKVDAKLADGKITGKADTPEGIMNFTAERPKE